MTGAGSNKPCICLPVSLKLSNIRNFHITSSYHLCYYLCLSVILCSLSIRECCKYKCRNTPNNCRKISYRNTENNCMEQFSNILTTIYYGIIMYSWIYLMLANFILGFYPRQSIEFHFTEVHNRSVISSGPRVQCE